VLRLQSGVCVWVNALLLISMSSFNIAIFYPHIYACVCVCVCVLSCKEIPTSHMAHPLSLLSQVGDVDCAGELADSHLKELLPAMPVVYIRAVVVDKSWIPSSVGYLRNDPKTYECPGERRGVACCSVLCSLSRPIHHSLLPAHLFIPTHTLTQCTSPHSVAPRTSSSPRWRLMTKRRRSTSGCWLESR
jgi:hypothetical protein